MVPSIQRGALTSARQTETWSTCLINIVEKSANYNYGSNAEVKQIPQLFFHMQNPDFFVEGFLELINGYDKNISTYSELMKKNIIMYRI